jgi:hypothetical protein
LCLPKAGLDSHIFSVGRFFVNPVFDFNVKLFCLDDDLFCFCAGRNIGESVVDSISLPSTRLTIVGVLGRGSTQYQFRALQGRPVVSDLAPGCEYGHSVCGVSDRCRQRRISDLLKGQHDSRQRGRGRFGSAYCLIPSWRFCVSGFLICQQARPSHSGFLSQTVAVLVKRRQGNGRPI